MKVSAAVFTTLLRLPIVQIPPGLLKVIGSPILTPVVPLKVIDPPMEAKLIPPPAPPMTTWPAVQLIVKEPVPELGKLINANVSITPDAVISTEPALTVSAPLIAIVPVTAAIVQVPPGLLKITGPLFWTTAPPEVTAPLRVTEPPMEAKLIPPPFMRRLELLLVMSKEPTPVLGKLIVPEVVIAPVVDIIKEPALNVIACVGFIPPAPAASVVRPVLLLVRVPWSAIPVAAPVVSKVIAPVALLLRMGPPTACVIVPTLLM